MSWPEPVQRVEAGLEQGAAEARLEEFPDSTPTAETAAPRWGAAGAERQVARLRRRVVPPLAFFRPALRSRQRLIDDVGVPGSAPSRVSRTAKFSGRYWARTSETHLVDSEQRSRQFADVSPERRVERNRSASEHLSELERTSSVAIVATRI